MFNNIPENPIVWLIIGVVVAIIAVLVLTRYDVAQIRTRGLSLRLRRKDSGTGAVEVGKEMSVRGGGVKGGVIGIDVEVSGKTDDHNLKVGDIRVFEKAKLENTTIDGGVGGLKKRSGKERER